MLEIEETQEIVILFRIVRLYFKGLECEEGETKNILRLPRITVCTVSQKFVVMLQCLADIILRLI